ncbi:MAG TPA: DUF3109 family protein [Anseongella sp.]|nr:DUF3109 family protein [Anseongella sp.]
MVENQGTLIHEDVMTEEFVCNLTKCRGACCVQGNAGAPLEAEELRLLEESYAAVKPYLTPAGIETIEREGLYVTDPEGDQTTPCVDGDKECAYIMFEEGQAQCGIEKAWLEGKTSFRKPISCHLYPIRVTRYPEFELLSYDRWSICSPACQLGAELKVPVYRFLKEALIRKYGAEWYESLSAMPPAGTRP